MAYCIRCGSEMPTDARFCSKCGYEITRKTVRASDNARKKTGTQYNCSRCGAPLPSFSADCPFCGNEMRNDEVLQSIKQFSVRIRHAKTIGEKLDIIKTFIIPNTKEGIIEFSILAESNINVESYSIWKRTVEKSLSDAWLVKLNQAYEKAKKVFPDSQDFVELEQKVINIRKAINRSKKRIKPAKKINPALASTIPLLLMMLWPIIYFSGAYIEEQQLENNLNNLVEQVETCIENEDWQTALIKANQIIYDSNYSSDSRKKWDNIRNSMIELIEEKKAVAEGYITIGILAKDLNGQNYETVIDILKNKGFTNIKAVALGDLVTGWINDEGEVSEVNFNGTTKFDAETKFHSSTDITVSYHSFD